MYYPNAPIQQPVNSEIEAINTKRRKLSNYIRVLTYLFLFGSWIGFPTLFGVPTFLIGIALIFTRGMIVKAVYKTPKSMEYSQPATQAGQYQPAFQDKQAQTKDNQYTVVYDVKFCNNCGYQADQDSDYCENCGTKFDKTN